MSIFEDILKNRGLDADRLSDFINPKYESLHDPFLLPDMEKAVKRLVEAHKKQEHITIYGDYDIDGLTATSVLVDALGSFGFKNVKTFIPNRFVEGYGLTVDAVEAIVKDGAELILTVDCGSLSHDSIAKANELGADVIVTDHHNVAEIQPPAVAVINPKRKDHDYPFRELAGVGVAFKLVQALQTKLKGLDGGQEKWLLDLVALGTVCDVVPLVDENRVLTYYGLKVLAQTKRDGLKSLAKVANIEIGKITTRDLGFGLGPRLNASGRLETAMYSLELLLAKDKSKADELATVLDEMNQARRREQDQIYIEALAMAENDDSRVLVLSSPDWNQGIVGIVAAKILEKYKKPTFILQELDGMVKGSARSLGDFSAADAIRAADDIIIKGGGHRLAAGVSLPVGGVVDFRRRVNEFYDSLNLGDQSIYTIPKFDAVTDDLSRLDEELINQIDALAPFGMGNEEPIIKVVSNVQDVRLMGSDLQHVKIRLANNGSAISALRFNAPDFYAGLRERRVQAWLQLNINEWQNVRNVEGRIVHIEILD